MFEYRGRHAQVFFGAALLADISAHAKYAFERPVLVPHQYGVAMTILSAAMRLMRVTHLDTQRILFELNHDIETFCDIAEIGDIEQMSSYVPIVDVLAAVHVKAHVRLFMN